MDVKVLNYDQSMKLLWKVWDDNTSLWQMCDVKINRELAIVLGLFDTLNCTFAPYSNTKLNQRAYLKWANQLSIQTKIRQCYINGMVNYKSVYLAICGCQFTPDDVMIDIINHANAQTLDYIARHNPCHSKRVSELLKSRLWKRAFI